MGALLLSCCLLLPAPARAATPTLQAVGTALNGAGTVQWPAHQIDDVALLFVESAGGQAVTVSDPAVYFPVANSPQFTGAGTAGTRLSVFWARATSAAMAGPVISGPADHVYSVIVTFRGVIKNGDPWNATAGGVKTPTSVTVTAGGVTTTVEETLLALGVTNDLDANKAVASGWANTALGGITEQFDASINSGGGGGIAVMTGTPTVEGATGNTTLTVTNSINAYLTIALKRLTPARINSVTVGARQLSAGWPLIAGATGYTLVASKTQAIPPDLTYSSDTAGGSALISAPALDANTTHYIYIRSNGPREASEWKFLRGTSTLVEFQPASPGFGAMSAASIQFTWSNNGNPLPGSPNPAGYRVLVSTAPDPLNPPAGAAVTSSDTFNVSLTTSGLRANTTYYFRVAAINHNGVITNNFYTTAVPTSTLLAASPSLNTFTVSTGSVRLDWLRNGDRPDTLYRVLVSSLQAMVPANSSDTYNNFFSSAGLAANTTYYFRVTGLNNNGVPTNQLDASTATLAREAVFSAFTGLSTGSVRAAWSPNGNPGDTLYRVKVSTLGNFSVFTASDTFNAYLSTAGVKPNTTFYFSVTPVNRNGVSTAAFTAAAATWAQPPAFTDFVDLSTGSARLRWNGDQNPADTLYRVKVSSLSDLSLFTSSDTFNSYLSTAGVRPDTTYYFTVTALNRAGITAVPLEASTATWARPPLPSGFGAVSSSALLFGLNRNDNPDGTLYRVKVSTADNPDLPGAAEATSSDTYNAYLSSAGLAANTTYYFVAAAVNRNGVATAYSSAASTSTLANAPSGLLISGVSPVSMQLDWSASGNAPGTLYRVRTSTAPNLDAPLGAPVVSSFTYNTYLSTAGLIPEKRYYFEALAINNNGLPTAPAYADEATLAVGQLGAPVAGAVSGVFISSAAAGWSLVPDATGYTLAASLFPGLPPVIAASSTTHAGELSAVVPGLQADTEYYLSVRANGFMASSDWSAFPVVYTRVEFAPVFTDFSAVAEDAARFAWDRGGNPAGVTAYRVLVSTAQDPLAPDGAVVSSSDTYGLALSSAGLAANTTYYFRVAGLNKAGVTTAYTAPASTVTRAALPVFDGFYSVGAAAIEFRWTDVNPAGTLYRVKTSTSSSFSGGAVVVSSETYNKHLSTSGLSANTTYYFSAEAVDHGGLATGYSEAASTATLLAADPSFDRFVTAAAGEVEFRWTPAGPAGTLYRVLSSTADTSTPGGAAVISSYTYNTFLSSSGLAANTTYYFNAVGLNHNGVPTLYTGVKSTASLANIPASAVSTFSSVGVTAFTASWAANGNPPGTLYGVWVSTAQDFNPGAADQVTASTRPSAGLSYSFSGLTSDALYYFRVRAVNHNGTATDYAPLGSTATAALAEPVLYPVAEVGTSSMTASWQLVAGATGYTLAASLNPGAEPSPVYASSATAALSAAVFEPALGLNTTYYLFVRANGPRRTGPWAVYPATSTLANEPRSAVSTFSAVQFNSLAASWDNNSNALGSTVYTVQLSSAQDFNSGATDSVSFDTAPVSGPGAFFEGLNADTYYYFRVRTRHNNGNATAWKNLGYTKTKALPVIHAAGDGVLVYGKAGNAAPQFRRYTSASNSFSGVLTTLDGPAAGSQFIIKSFPLETRQEALAGYVKDGTLHLLCTDGSNWYEEWTQSVGGKETTRRFDIAYEPNSGDALVLYSRGVAGSGELGYRTKAGGSECGAGGWSADTPYSPAATAGTVQWVHLVPDSRPSSGTIAAAWSDDASSLGVMVWDGAAWRSEPASPRSTALDFDAAAGDTEAFDLEYDALGGIMAVWGQPAANNANGAYYSSATWNDAAQLHSWNAGGLIPGMADDATNLSLAANPAANEMVFASIGKNGSDLQVGYWNGSAWIATPNKDTAAGAPMAGTRLVAAAWVSSGSVTNSVVVYNDQGATGVSYFTGTGGTFGATTLVSPAPAFGNPQKLYSLAQDPVGRDRLLLAVSDVNSDLFAKRLVMNAAGAVSWSDAAGGAALETNLASATVAGYSFAFWPAPPATLYDQSAYRFFANAPSTDVGAPLAPSETLAPLPAAGAAFRLRLALHVSQVDLPVNGQSFKLQFAGKGTGTCESPAGGVPAVYTDVGAATAVAFNDNAGLADGAALTDSVNDPAHGAHTNVNQTYEELNDSANSVSAILRNQDGLWDFSLKENGVTPGEIYCFRLVKANGAPLNSYSVYPEAILPAPVYINEVSPVGGAGEDWVELYNATSSTFTLAGWRLYYVAATMDLGGSLVPLWTGQAGQAVNAFSTYTVSGFADDMASGVRGHVILRDAFLNQLDAVEWPVLSGGQSFARMTDGGAFFEIDPTPTRNYANFIGTDGFKLSEVAAGALDSQFVELYSPLAGEVALSSYSLRNAASSAAGLVFRFDRRLYPLDYALLDFSSVSRDGLAYGAVFGASGLSAAGDFLTLENSSGSTVNTVTWQSAGNYTRYNYRGSTVPFSGGLGVSPSGVIARASLSGNDAGDSSPLFSFASAASPASSGAGGAQPNSLLYPPEQAEPQHLARKFPLTLDLGEPSSGAGNNLVLTRLPGGSPDAHSPHVYRLADIGFSLASDVSQTISRYGFSFADQDGWPLVSSATYRLTLNSAAGAASAPPIVLPSVTYDASVHGVAGSAAAPLWMNDASRAGMLRLDVSNNSPAGFNGLLLTTVTFRLLDPALAPLAQAKARNLFNAVMLAADSLTAGTTGIYEPGIDLSTVAYVPMADIALDAQGVSTLTADAGLQAALVPAGSTRTFFVVFESTRDASGWTPDNVFRVRYDPAYPAALRDAAGGLYQDLAASAQADGQTVTLIAPARPPAGTFWPYVSPSSAPVNSAVSVYYGAALAGARTYVTSTDGSLRALDAAGGLLWTFPTGSAINTSPSEPQEEGGFVYVYFANDNGDVYKVRDEGAAASAGWASPYHVPGQIRSNLIIYGDRVYFGAADNKMHCVGRDKAPCDNFWSDIAVPGVISATPAVDDRTGMNSAWVGTEDGSLVHIRTGLNPEATSVSTGQTIKSSPFVDAGLPSSLNRLFITSTDNNLYSASLTLGEVLGVFDAGAPIRTSPFVWDFGGQKYVFFGDEAGRLHKVSTTTWTEPAGWPFQAGGAIRSSPVVVPAGFAGLGAGEDYVYFGCEDGYIYAVNINTGARRENWPVATGGPVRADPATDIDSISARYHLVVGSTDGRTYTLKIGPP